MAATPSHDLQNIALLVGVPRYRSQQITPLGTVVRNDFRQLADLFSEAGYAPREVGLSEDKPPTKTVIRDEIQATIRRAPRGACVLIYISGHGIHHEGHDYLVPWDGNLANPATYDQDFVRLDFTEPVQQSKAAAVFLFVDACRQGISKKTKGAHPPGWSRATIRSVKDRDYGIIYACDTGQLAYFEDQPDKLVDNDGQEFSYFARALVEVISESPPTITLAELIDAVRDRVAQFAERYGEAAVVQTVVARFESDEKQKQAAGRQLFKNRALRVGAPRGVIAELIESSVWSQISGGPVADITDPATTPLDPATPSLDNADLESATLDDTGLDDTGLDDTGLDDGSPVKDGTAALDQQRQQLSASLSVMYESLRELDDSPLAPWVTSQYAPRVAQQVLELILTSDPPLLLSPAELCVALTLPFLRDCVYHQRLRDYSRRFTLRPPFTATSHADGNAVIAQVQAHPRLEHRAEQLLDKGKEPEAQAIGGLFLARAIARHEHFWDDVPEAVDRALQKLLPEGAARVDESGFRTEILKLAKQLDQSLMLAADTDPDCEMPLLQGRFRDAHGNEIRGALVVTLVTVAAALAVDARTFPTTFAGHLGYSELNLIQKLPELLGQVQCRVTTGVAGIHLDCPDSAIHHTLEEYFSTLRQRLTRLHELLEDEQSPLEPLRGLPRTILTAGIRPSEVNGKPAYTRPLLRFQLAHDRIRELLMGAKLYGDPSIAVREMYQNALDACRYRRSRADYLQRRGEYRGEDDWQGTIRFRMYEDDVGYVLECSDNGIGMGAHELRNCFVRAGNRYTDTSEYVAERARWEQMDPRLAFTPNSRFGIGVFSYFMIASSVEVITSRMDIASGRPGPTYRMFAVDGTSVISLQQLPELESPGTTLRLRVRDREALASCYNLLDQLLWYSEFDVRLEFENHQRHWPADTLVPPKQTQLLTRRAEEENCWFCHGGGALLADGILYAVSKSNEAESENPRYFEFTQKATTRVAVDEYLPPVCVVNLAREHRPELSVDRSRLESYSLDWVPQRLAETTDCLVEWDDGLTLQWIADLSIWLPEVAERLTRQLSARTAPLRLVRDRTIAVDHRRVGFLTTYAGFASSVGNQLSQFEEDTGSHWSVSRKLLFGTAPYSARELPNLAPDWFLPQLYAGWKHAFDRVLNQRFYFLYPRRPDNTGPLETRALMFLVVGVVWALFVWKFGLLPTVAGSQDFLEGFLQASVAQSDAMGWTLWISGWLATILLFLIATGLGIGIAETIHGFLETFCTIFHSWRPLDNWRKEVGEPVAAPSPLDGCLLFRSLSYVEVKRNTRAWIDQSVHPGHIVTFSFIYRESIATALGRLERLGGQLETQPTSGVPNVATIASETQVRLLSRYISRSPNYRYADLPISPAQVVLTAIQQDLSVQEVLAEGRKLAGLGVDMPVCPSSFRMRGSGSKRLDQRLLLNYDNDEFCFSGTVRDFREDFLDWFDKVSVLLDDEAEPSEDAEGNETSLPEQTPLPSLPDRSLDLHQLALTAAVTQSGLAATRDALEGLIGWGVTLPGDIPTKLKTFHPTYGEAVCLMFARQLKRPWNLQLLDLFLVALADGVTMEEARGRLNELASIAGWSLPAMTAEAGKLQPQHGEQALAKRRRLTRRWVEALAESQHSDPGVLFERARKIGEALQIPVDG